MANKNNKVKNNKTFFKDFKSELKKVSWPTFKQVVQNTMGVVVIVVIVAVIVFVLDFTFEALNKHGINQLKGVVEKTTSVDNTVSNELDNTTNNTDETVNSTNEINNSTENGNVTE